MSNYEAIIDFGSKNLRLGIFDQVSKNIYFSSQNITDNTENINEEKTLHTLIRDAEKYLSAHIQNVVVLYDSPKFYALDISIKKKFDHATSLKSVYNLLIEEAYFYISQHNFKDQIVHSDVNTIIIDGNENIDANNQDIKIKSLILEIKFICLSKIIIDRISDKFKKNNLKVVNLYCTSYVKTIFFKKKFKSEECLIFLDIGFERTSSIILKNSKFNFFRSIPLGGNNITKDISKVLNLNLDYSEDLKIRFNKYEKNTHFSDSIKNKINPYSEILEKKISIDLLKQIIEARLEEILDLVDFKNSYLKNVDSSLKTKLIAIGGGSKLSLNNYNLSIKKLPLEFIFFDQNDLDICLAGHQYHKSDESSQIQMNKKRRKSGFFETFFNLFSK